MRGRDDDVLDDDGVEDAEMLERLANKKRQFLKDMSPRVVEMVMSSEPAHSSL